MRTALGLFGVCVSICTAALMATPGNAQTIVGSWSGEVADPGGMAPIAARYGADGHYVFVGRTTNGLPMRFAGHYSVEPMSGGQIRLRTHIDSYAPRIVCTQAPGYPAYCRPHPVKQNNIAVLNFPSPNSMVLQGGQMSRDPSPRLLSMPVPDQFVSAIAAPNVPQIQAPTLHPYVTPGGAGSVQALRADSQQQEYRVCGVNDGTIVHYRDGTVKCVN